MNAEPDLIEIITREDWEYSRSRDGRVSLVSEKVDVSILRDKFQSFIDSLQSIINIDSLTDLPFELAEIQFSAEITADGEFKLLGTGVGVEVGSAVTFVLKRKNVD